MAEIRIEPKGRNTGWVWAVVVIVALVAIGYFLLSKGILQLPT